MRREKERQLCPDLKQNLIKFDLSGKFYLTGNLYQTTVRPILQATWERFRIKLNLNVERIAVSCTIYGRTISPSDIHCENITDLVI